MDCQILQDNLNNLAQWWTDWQMKFNVAKCHSMTGSDKQIHFDYSLHHQNFEHVRSAKYLGITNTDDLDWGQHISEIPCKATKAGFSPAQFVIDTGIQRKFHTKNWFAPSSSMQHLHVFWHPYDETQIGQVEKVQRTAASRWTCS